MQLEVSAWQDGRDAPEDYPEMSARTIKHRDELLEMIDALIAGKDHRLFGLCRQEALEEDP